MIQVEDECHQLTKSNTLTRMHRDSIPKHRVALLDNFMLDLKRLKIKTNFKRAQDYLRSALQRLKQELYLKKILLELKGPPILCVIFTLNLVLSYF